MKLKYEPTSSLCHIYSNTKSPVNSGKPITRIVNHVILNMTLMKAWNTVSFFNNRRKIVKKVFNSTVSVTA
jgi:hypothetical protein